jgi:hypothetical protein
MEMFPYLVMLATTTLDTSFTVEGAKFMWDYSRWTRSMAQARLLHTFRNRFFS